MSGVVKGKRQGYWGHLLYFNKHFLVMIQNSRGMPHRRDWNRESQCSCREVCLMNPWLLVVEYGCSFFIAHVDVKSITRGRPSSGFAKSCGCGVKAEPGVLMSDAGTIWFTMTSFGGNECSRLTSTSASTIRFSTISLQNQHSLFALMPA